MAIAATIGVVALALWALRTNTGDDGAALLVVQLNGSAWARDTLVADATERPLAAGERVRPASALRTAHDGRLALRLASGHSLRLDADTRLRWLDDGSLALDQGTIYLDSGIGAAERDPITVRTPLAVMQDIGTQFEVRVDDESTRVRLREGAVTVRLDGEVREVRAGHELELGADGSVTERTIPAFGPAWSWIAGITPIPELEGRTAHEFLSWFARERGYTLAFEDPTVARAADEITLGGTVRGLTLDQTLDAVLPSCRMIHRLEGGVLVIDAEPADEPG